MILPSVYAGDLTEQFSLPIPKTAPDKIYLKGSDFIHQGANSIKATEQGDRGVFRWILSASSTDQVRINVAATEWYTVDGVYPTNFESQLVKVYAPQIWGELHVVVLEIDLWRINNGVLQALVGGQVDVSIAHSPDDRLIDNPKAKYPGTPVANRVGVLRKRAARSTSRLAKSPLLPPGRWLKIPILDDDLYRITGSYFENANIDLTTINPDELRLYANRSLGRPVLAYRDSIMISSLVELPAVYNTGNDGTFDAADHISFYAPGPRGFKLSGDALVYEQNPYTDTAWVWLALDAGSQPAGPLEISPGPPLNTALGSIGTGRGFVRREIDNFNGFDSGLEWYQAEIRPSSAWSLELHTPNLIPAGSSSVVINVRGGNETHYDTPNHRVQARIRYGDAASTSAAQTFGNYSPIFIRFGEEALRGILGDGNNLITVSNTSLNTRDILWYNWSEIHYDQILSGENGQLDFAIAAQTTATNIALTGFSSRPLVVDVTVPEQPLLMDLRSDGNDWIFTPVNSTSLRRYVAKTDTVLNTPRTATLVTDPDFTSLRQPALWADYIIITSNDLVPAAQDLARLHSEDMAALADSLVLKTVVVTVDDIYRQFSGDQADPYALQAFLKYAWSEWSPARPAPKLVALFGDGDYDYRNISGKSATLVPTIQLDGADEIDSRVADDRFVYLGSQGDRFALPDMGIGRIPAINLENAQAYVDRVRAYLLEPEPGFWRQQVIMAADDPVRPNKNEPGFIRDTEKIARHIPDFIKIHKLYLTDFAKELDPATNTIVRPDATTALIDWINDGVALINYIGHGSPSQWAQEQLLKMDRDRGLINPGPKFPIWVAGTCTWGRFDQLEIPSMSEQLTVSENTGAIAIVSATRAVYSNQNTAFVDTLFQRLFPGGQPTSSRLGTIFQSTRNLGIRYNDDDKFHLFGDPALIMPFPRGELRIEYVTPSTMRVLERVSYGGTIPTPGFDTGEALITIRDADKAVTRQYIDGYGNNRSISYDLPGSTIFRGPVSVTAGAFSGRFVVPKDINYSANPASLIAYGWSTGGNQLTEAAGLKPDLYFSGSIATLDTIGPLIDFSHGGEVIYNGTNLPVGATMDFILKDPLGINLTDGIGHQIQLWIDNERDAQPVADKFSYHMDSDTSGSFSLTFGPTITGQHIIGVEAWDGANNHSLATLQANFVMAEELDIAGVFNYPNPFVDETDFVYTLTKSADVTITIFTLNGVKVVELESDFEQSAGYNQLHWNGKDAYLDEISNGTYLYRLEARDMDGSAITRWGKVARLR